MAEPRGLPTARIVREIDDRLGNQDQRFTALLWEFHRRVRQWRINTDRYSRMMKRIKGRIG